MIRSRSFMPALLALALSAGSTGLAQDMGSQNHGKGNGNGNGNGQGVVEVVGRMVSAEGLGLSTKLSTSMLVRAPELPVDVFSLLPLPPGTDPLTSGSAAVRQSGGAIITLKGAVASQNYDVWFCRYSSVANHCAQLGTVATDTNGYAHVALNFLAANSATAGVFAIARGGAVQFVSGFETPASTTPQGIAITLQGTVGVVTLSTSSFTLDGSSLIIVTDSSTNFKGVADLAAVTAGTPVLIHGMLRTDGTVLASSVIVE